MEALSNELEQIGKLFGLKESDEISTSAIYELLCQIALALLIIFVMAYVLFMARAKMEVEVAKAMLGVLQGKHDEITSTPEGQQYIKREDALIELQRQKLLLALEKIESAERISFGIIPFTRRNSSGDTEYLLDDILSGGNVVNKRFKKACIMAKETLPDRGRMENEWLLRISLINGLCMNDTSVEQSIISNPEIITKNNSEWLLTEIDARVTALHADCCDMQRMAVSHLVEYLQDHTDLLMKTKLSHQLDQALSAPLEDRIRPLSEFSRELYRYIKLLFEEQEVPLLNEV